MARAQSYGSNGFDRVASRRKKQMADDIMKSLIVLFLIIIGYFMFAPERAVSGEQNAATAKK